MKVQDNSIDVLLSWCKRNSVWISSAVEIRKDEDDAASIYSLRAIDGFELREYMNGLNSIAAVISIEDDQRYLKRQIKQREISDQEPEMRLTAFTT